MKLRLRLLAALLALVGLLTFSVEGAWAATCAASMGAEDVVPSASTGAAAHPCSAEMAVSRTGDSGVPDGTDSGTPHCPNMPMGAPGACGAVLALPAETSLPTAPSLPEARLSPRTDDVHELLLAAAFFRPPIA